MTKKRVAVLMGGWSAEREVSFESGQSVVAALSELGHQVISIDVTRDINSLYRTLLDQKPDIVFNALHGVGGEDGVMQGMLEALHIPYTHSGVTASAIGMDKPLSRKIFEREGIMTPPWQIFSRQDIDGVHPIEPPYVVKPLNEGSSKGVSIVRKGDAPLQLGEHWPFGDKVLVEKYIAGREIQVAVMGDKAIGAIEIRPHTDFYDYTAKYTPGKAQHLMPAPITPQAYTEALHLALKAHKAIGCRGVTRSDFIYDDQTGHFYLLEINTQPGMTPLSLVQEIAAHQGTTFNQLIEWMLDSAQCDQ